MFNFPVTLHRLTSSGVPFDIEAIDQAAHNMS